MALFKDMLKSEESLFRDEVALDYDYLPKLFPYREKEQFYIANCIKPLLFKRNGKNILIYGSPGVGKTAAMRFVLRDLEYETDEVLLLYINCWKKNTTFRIILQIAEDLGYKFTQNKKTDELMDEIKAIINKKAAVFVFDEIDKLEDFDFIYLLLEEIYRKCIFMIANSKNVLLELDQRIASRLTPELLEFRQYNADETKGILKERLKYAFVPDVWETDAFEVAANKAAEIRDVRSGLYLLKEAGLTAEGRSSRKITAEHVKLAINKLDEFSIKSSADLDDETKKILDLIKSTPEMRIGETFDKYKKQNGSLSYKTFQRRIEKLHKDKFISLAKTEGGDEGNTTIIKYKDYSRKLTDF